MTDTMSAHEDFERAMEFMTYIVLNVGVTCQCGSEVVLDEHDDECPVAIYRRSVNAISSLQADIESLMEVARAGVELSRWRQAERMFMPHQSEWTLEHIHEMQQESGVAFGTTLANLSPELQARLKEGK